jgi:hypothetical protein
MERNTSAMRRKAVWGARQLTAAGLVLGATLLTSCSSQIRQGEGSSYLVITRLTGGPENGATVESDVVSDEGGIIQDPGEATLALQMKDLGGVGPSAVNSITITQYRVEYIRSDGRNVEGVDVPFAFSSGVTVTVAGVASVPFTLVRAQAKHEAPLRALGGHGGAQHINTVARVTFYGRDQTGREVSVTGNIEVSFADWAG